MNRQEATALAHGELVRQGRADVSLEVLGQAIGVSARMLVYYFKNRENLIVAVMDYERELQRQELSALVAGDNDPITLLRHYFYMVTAPERRSRLQFFFDLVTEAARNRERYQAFLEQGVTGYWRSAMQDYLRAAGVSGVPDTFISAVLGAARGLYFELLASGDTDHARESFEHVLQWVETTLAAYKSSA